MRATDLNLEELLDFDPAGGPIHFGGERVVLMDATALGLLRKELVESIGLTGARGILTRLGFSHGWRVAETMKDAYPWDSEREWKVAGGRLHHLFGMVRFEPVEPREGGPAPFAESIWHESYEADQHLLYFGQSDEAVCWTLTGFASGYLSRANGREIYCVEERCRGKGNAVCRMVGRSLEDWGAEAEKFLPYFRTRCLTESLAMTAQSLKETERKLRSRRGALARAAGAKDDAPSGIVARSPQMKKLVDLARRAAKVDSTVLITGESGTGKERIARFIHEESARAAGPFVAVNVGAVPENLIESELFGHVRGAFTGAVQDRAGLFEAANGGTLLLDEIGDLPLPMQVKLLRALQEREIRRVGENRSRPINVRIIAATHRDLGQAVTAGTFRQDLYYRLRVIELKTPPLRERKDDVLPLARVLLAEAAARAGRKITGLTPDAAAQLVRYDWPGNVRELENAMERAVALATGNRIDVDDLADEVRMALPATYIPGQIRTLEEVERDYILAVLDATGGNRGRTAEKLGIGPATLYRKLKEYGVTRSAAT
ncbi:MAG: sigma-54-dependent Fis family transcriptional regulator [Myxococcaceae bacterium]|nr:sigma-54-dependent Fis family transcriptional regulator [Myxococcaceae bacterium]